MITFTRRAAVVLNICVCGVINSVERTKCNSKQL